MNGIFLTVEYGRIVRNSVGEDVNRGRSWQGRQTLASQIETNSKKKGPFKRFFLGFPS